MVFIKKVILIAVASILILGSAITIYMLNDKSKKQEEQIKILEEQIASLSSEDLVQVVTAKYPIKSGTTVDPQSLQYTYWNRASVSPNMITDPTTIENKRWKIDVSQDGPITMDMVASEEVGPTDRLQLVLTDALAPSLKIGDYVDIRMVTPYGINYVVFSKKRIDNIYDNGIEVIMSESEQMIYSGLLIDQFINTGTLVYTSKYLDPTLQKGVYAMYVPPKEVLEYMAINANMIYPYLSTDNVQGLRSYIESTQPWTLYGPSTFQTVTQGIIDRQTKITDGNRALVNAMKQARSQYKEQQAQLNGGVVDTSLGGDGTGAVSGSSDGDLTGETSANPNAGEDGATTTNPDGTYIDSEGVTRDQEGNVILKPEDLTPGG